MRVCSEPGCPTLVQKGKCDQHARPSAAAQGYGHRWRAARTTYLADNPYCIKCMDAGRLIGATVVDHVVPHKGDDALFWDQTNWMPLCKAHHDQKTATHDGGFGRPPH
jgi:5-methylcytosine-specific restriction enzyme A